MARRGAASFDAEEATKGAGLKAEEEQQQREGYREGHGDGDGYREGHGEGEGEGYRDGLGAEGPGLAHGLVLGDALPLSHTLSHTLSHGDVDMEARVNVLGSDEDGRVARGFVDSVGSSSSIHGGGGGGGGGGAGGGVGVIGAGVGGLHASWVGIGPTGLYHGGRRPSHSVGPSDVLGGGLPFSLVDNLQPGSDAIAPSGVGIGAYENELGYGHAGGTYAVVAAAVDAAQAGAHAAGGYGADHAFVTGGGPVLTNAAGLGAGVYTPLGYAAYGVVDPTGTQARLGGAVSRAVGVGRAVGRRGAGAVSRAVGWRGAPRAHSRR